MITFECSKDKKIIKSILFNESVFKNSSDDFTPNSFEIRTDILLFILVKKENKILGMFVLEPRNTIQLEIHTCLLPHNSLDDIRTILKQGLVYLFTTFPVLKLTTSVPSSNKRAYLLAKMAGMKDEGINRKSFMKNNILEDQFLLGLEKGEIVCPPQ